MTFILGDRSKKRLEGVHPDLVEVVKRAIAISDVDFTVICGVRTEKEQRELYAQGRTTADLIARGIVGVKGKPDMAQVTWTLQSNHLAKADGFGYAVDLAPFVNGAIDWNTVAHFERIAEAMKRAADELGVIIEWGGTWKRKDRPHFELKGAAA